MPLITNTTTSNAPLKVMQWNIRSYHSNRDSLLLLVKEHFPDLIHLNETWLRQNDNLFVRGYISIREDRSDGYGGIATLIKKKLPFQRIIIDNRWHPKKFQYISVQIDNLTLINVYNPPDVHLSVKFWNKFLNSFVSPVTIIGDLNAHHTLWDNMPINNNGKTIYNSLESSNLIVLNDGSPTLFSPPTSSNKSAIDVSICTACLAPQAAWQVLSDPGMSDHYPTLTTFGNVKNDQPSQTPVVKRIYRKADWSLYQEKIITESILTTDLESYENLYQIIDSSAEVAIPKSKPAYFKNKNPTPWWDDECSVAISNRKAALKAFKSLSSLENYNHVKQSIAYTRKLFKKKKKEKYRTFCATLNRESNISNVWRFFRCMGRIYGPQTLMTLPPSEVAIKIIGNLTVCNILPDFTFEPLEDDIEPFSLSEFQAVMVGKKDTATGLDQVSYSMISNLPITAISSLITIYNRCLSGGKIPDPWKTYLIYSFLKKDKNPFLETSYRPIAVSSCVHRKIGQ